MKKILLMALSCLLFASSVTEALANGWGLKGGIYDIVTSSDRYKDYSAIADDGNHYTGSRHVNHAILENRYHRVLISAFRNGSVWQADTISTTAVFQPGDPRGEYPNNPTLTHQGDSFVLEYGDEETYLFAYDEENQDYRLSQALYRQNDLYSNSFFPHPEGMEFWQSGPGDAFLPVGDGLWRTDGIMLWEFNIAQTPRTLTETRNLSFVANALSSAAPALEDSYFPLAGVKNGRTLPVYSAPDKRSFRSADGKASVSTGGDMTVYGTAEGWTLVQYEVSPRTSRFGYVEGELEGAEPLTLGSVPLIACQDTFLTDDPFVSQYPQLQISKGMTLTGLARCGEYYAYVEFVQGNRISRGFVPMKDLTTQYDVIMTAGTDLLVADVRWDVMEALTGKWYPRSGMDVLGPLCILYSDGSYRLKRLADYPDGNYRVYDKGEETYELYFCTEGNEESRYTLTLNADGTITVYSEEGTESVYQRTEYSTYGNG